MITLMTGFKGFSRWKKMKISYSTCACTGSVFDSLPGKHVFYALENQKSSFVQTKMSIGKGLIGRLK